MSRQFLTFTLADSLYAVEVTQVQEVLEYTQPAKLPCSVSYVEGLINSRDQGITVINLHRKFNQTDVSVSKKTRIIVLEVHQQTPEGEDSVSLFGAVADTVNEVIDLPQEQIEPPPKFGNTISTEYMLGLGKKDDTFIILLDASKIFRNGAITSIQAPTDTKTENPQTSPESGRQ